MTTTIQEYSIGDELTCQFGNHGEENFNPAARVKILAKQESIFGLLCYLVQDLDDLEHLGLATVTNERCRVLGLVKVAVLYCTNARTFGSKALAWTGILTFDDAVESFGFKKESFKEVA